MAVFLGTCTTCGNTADMLGSGGMKVGETYKSDESCHEIKDGSGGDPECPSKKFMIAFKR